MGWERRPRRDAAFKQVLRLSEGPIAARAQLPQDLSIAAISSLQERRPRRDAALKQVQRLSEGAIAARAQLPHMRASFRKLPCGRIPQPRAKRALFLLYLARPHGHFS